MVKIRFIKECGKTKVGEEGEASEKSAENYVSQGFAEYVEEDITEVEDSGMRYIKTLNKDKTIKDIRDVDNNYQLSENEQESNFEEYRKDQHKKLSKMIENSSKKKIEKEKVIKMSCYIFNDRLYEQVKNRQFVYYNGNELKYTTQIVTPEVNIKVCEGDELLPHHEVVILPERPEEYGSLVELIKEIKEFIHEWLDVSDDFETFAAWYIPLSWVYDSVPTINYLSVMGDTGVGKSRFLNVVGKLCYKPIIGSGGVSVAAVKRLINKWKGTLLIDEGDFKASDETADLIKLLNLGFEKGQSIFNCDKNDPSKIEFFDPYCPKVITRRRQFQDQALEARCLTETMQQTTRRIPPLLTEKFNEKQRLLRNKLLKFRFDYWYKIDIDKAANIDLGDIEPRIKQATLAFTTLLANVPEALISFKKFVKKYNKDLIEERSTSYDGVIVNTIIELLKEENMNITAKDIETRFSDNHVKGTAATIGKHLAQLNLKTEAMKINGKTKKIIPLNETFFEVAKRYCVDEDALKLVTEVTAVTAHTATPSKNQNQQKTLNNNKIHVDQCAVTAVTGVTKELPIFDVNHKCFIEGCQCRNTAFDSTGVPYCEEHWEDMAQK